MTLLHNYIRIQSLPFLYFFTESIIFTATQQFGKMASDMKAELCH